MMSKQEKIERKKMGQIIWEQEFQLPPNTPKESTIRVTYFYDKDQRMDCEFEHLASGKKLRVQVDTQKVSKSTNAISSKKLSVMDIK